MWDLAARQVTVGGLVVPATKLTAAFCEGVKPTPGRQSAYPDSDVRGLELRVSGEGRKTWSFRYRTRDGRQARMTLGVYSREFDLARARTEARKARVIVDDGGDPAETQRRAKEASRVEPIRTLADLADAYFAACEKGRYPANRPKRPNSIKSDKAVWRVHVQPALGKLRVETITRRTARNHLATLLDQGVTSQAGRAQTVLRQIFAYGVNELERLPANPLSDLPPVVASKPRAHVYDDDELRAIWRGIEDPGALTVSAEKAAKRRDGARVQVGPPMRIALKLAWMLLQRRSEILGMALDELDLERGLWLIPEERMKTRRSHLVPLSAEAVALIEQAIAFNYGRETRLVFPNRKDPTRPMNGPSMNHALDAVLLALGIEEGTVHDIRRTGSTLMTSERLMISPFIRSKVLGHTDTGGGAGVTSLHYDANAYISEKRRALDAWQALLASIVSGQSQPSHVRPLRTG